MNAKILGKANASNVRFADEKKEKFYLIIDGGVGRYHELMGNSALKFFELEYARGEMKMTVSSHANVQ